MAQHEIYSGVGRPGAEVAAVLQVRPATWLRAFLSIGLTQGRLGVREAAGGPWWRLGDLSHDEYDRAVVRFIWRPHHGAEVFESFDGEFVIESRGVSAAVLLRGECTGGSDAVNEAVLNGVLKALCAALSANPSRQFGRDHDALV